MRNTFLIILPLLYLAGCVGPVALEQVLPAYDSTISKLQRDGILTNIARNRHQLPSHFTRTTTIAATFDFTATTSLSGDIPVGSPASPGVVTPTLSTSASENPTIGLEPVHGKEYTERMLTPFRDYIFKMVVEQSAQFDMVIRLMGAGFEFQNRDGSPRRYIRNNPAYPHEYEEFRRIALHLASLGASNELYLGQLQFDKIESPRLTERPSAKEILEASKNGFSYKAVEGMPNQYELSRRVIGSIIMTNYSPRAKDNLARARLNSIAESNPDNYLQVDIEPGYPGGDLPIFGVIKLRSLNEIFWFIALGIEQAPEYGVVPDPRTTAINVMASDASPNPDTTLKIVESDSLPPGAGELSVRYHDLYYSVADTRWDREAFNVLYLLTHATTQEAQPGRTFPITIAK